MRARKQRRAPVVFKRSGSPFWWYRFEVGGKPYRGSTERTNEKEAQKYLDGLFGEACLNDDKRRAAGREPMTVATAAAQWWHKVGAHLEEGFDLGPYSTDPQFARRPINRLVAQLGPATALDRVGTKQVDDLISTRRNDKVVDGCDDKGRPLYRPISNRTVNRTVTKLLRRIMLTARDKWKVHVPEMPDWGSLLLKEKRNKPRIIKVAEQATLDDFERPELRAVREFALLTGLRLDECLITWQEVDFDDGYIRVIQKGGEPRKVVITDGIAALLRPLRGHHPESVFTFVAKRTTTNPKSGKCFVRGQRYPLTYWGVTAARRRDWAKAGLDATFHDLRRTAANAMWKATGRIEDAQSLLAHKDVRTTKLYLDVERSDEDLRAIMKARDAYVAKQWEALDATVPAMHRQRKGGSR